MAPGHATFSEGKAKQPTIGEIIDDAMVAIERDNPSLKGVLPKDYARPALDKQRVGEVQETSDVALQPRHPLVHGDPKYA